MELGSQCANSMEFEEDHAGGMNCGWDKWGTRLGRGEGMLGSYAAHALDQGAR